MPPEPFEKHARNNSLYLKYVVSKIAEIKKITEKDCTMSNTYIGNLLNICNVQASGITNSLKKEYVKTEMAYKQNSKETK